MNRCRPPSARDALGAGPQHQVVGVAEHDVGARRLHLLGYIAFTVPAVPTGMKAGVRTTPRGMRISPVRAEPVGLGDGEGDDSLSEPPIAHAVRFALDSPFARGRREAAGRRRRRSRSGSPPRSHARRPPACASRPAEGADQHEQRRARQMEVGHQHVDGAEAVAGRDEDVGLAGERRDRAVRRARRSRAAAATVVPTATMRPPARPRGVERRGGVAPTPCPHSACIRWSAVSSAFTGRNVPAPTCRVTKARPMPRAVERGAAAPA